MKEPMFRLSADASVLYERLLLVPVGDIATYEELSKVIGKKVTGATGALTRARYIAQREDGAVFGCVRTVGMKRLDSEGIVELSGTRTQGVRRHARRVGRTLSKASFVELKESSQRRAIAIASILMVVADLSRQQSVLAVESAATGRAARLPIRETIAALGLSEGKS